MELKKSMNLAGDNLINSILCDDGYLPYFSLDVKRDYSAKLVNVWATHNLGRWWDAMLRLENSTGYLISPEIEAKMLENLYRYFNNEDHLCCLPIEDLKGANFEFIDFHSLREGLLALNALVQFRNNSWALDKGHKMLMTIDRILDEECKLIPERLHYFQILKEKGGSLWYETTLTQTNGRLIEAIIWFYQNTHDELAIRIAGRLAEYHFENSTKENGEINTILSPNHTHSYLGTLRGLLLFGIVTNQYKYIERVAKTYEVTVCKLVKESGFASHDLGKDCRGETTSPGDAVQLALWLSYAGYTQFLDDAERIVRARIVPSQIRESTKITPMDEHPLYDYNKLVIGAYGGCHIEAHAGKQSVVDVTAADIHTLCDVYNHIVTENDDFIKVLFHLDYEDNQITVRSIRENNALLHIIVKKSKNILIRLPKFVELSTIILKVNRKQIKVNIIGDFILVSADETEEMWIELSYDLPEKITEEETDGIIYRIKWKGDDVVGISPHSEYFSFYPALT